MTYAFKVRPIIKSWYKGKWFTVDYQYAENRRCTYCITNCVLEQGMYYPQLRKYIHKIYLDVTVREYYMRNHMGRWMKMSKPSSATIRDVNNYIRSMVIYDKKLEFNLFGLDSKDYKLKVRNIKWDIKYNLGE